MTKINVQRERLKNLENVIETLERMENNIGLVVNYEKSSIHILGNSKQVECRKPIQWDPGGPEILGINTEMASNADTVYNTKIDKVSTICSSWTNRKLTLLGKIILVNTLMCSLFVYPMQVLPSPKSKSKGKIQ